MLGILDNDFYIGTLRQGKFTRKKINVSDLKRNPHEHVVFESHHESIVDYRTFAMAQELRKILAELQDGFKATKRQRIRGIMKHPEHEANLEEAYDEMESDLIQCVAELQSQIALTADRRNTITRVNRIAKTAIGVFDNIVNKPVLARTNLELIIKKILFYEDHIEIMLKAGIDTIIQSGLFRPSQWNPLKF